MSETFNTNVSNNGATEAGVVNEGLWPGWCPMVKTCVFVCHQATVHKSC